VKILIREFSDRQLRASLSAKTLPYSRMGRPPSFEVERSVIPAFVEERETRDDLVDSFMEWCIARRGNEDK